MWQEKWQNLLRRVVLLSMHVTVKRQKGFHQSWIGEHELQNATKKYIDVFRTLPVFRSMQ